MSGRSRPPDGAAGAGGTAPRACFSLLSVGALAQLAQLLLTRELMVQLDGDELAIGLMLAAWLLWVGAGAALARAVPRPTDARWCGGAVVGAVLSLPVVLVCVRLARPLFHTPPGAPLSLLDSAVLALAACFLPCVCLGMLFPLLVTRSGLPAAKVFAWEALGALLGGAAFVFVLVGRLTPVAIASAAGLLGIVAMTWLQGPARRFGRPADQARPRRAPGRALAGVAVAGLTVATAAGAWVDGWAEAVRWRRLLPGFMLEATRESPYGRYAVLGSAGQVSLFLDGRLVCDAPDTHAAGVAVHTTLLQHAHPATVLLIAQDAYGAVRAARRHHPERVDCVVLERVPLDLLARFADLDRSAGGPDGNVRIVEGDAAAFLHRSQIRYDAILIDMPGPSTLGLNRFYTHELFQAAAERLSPDGVVGVVLAGAENEPTPELAARNALIFSTLRSVLPDVVVTPGQTCLMVARRRGSGAAPLTLDVVELDGRLLRRGVESPAYRALLASDPFPSELAERLARALAAAQADVEAEPAINRDLRPVACWATRLAAARRFEPRTVAFLRSLPTATMTILVLIGVGGLAVALGNRVSRSDGAPGRTKAGLVVASGAIGLTVMTLQLAVLLWFQTRAGQAYEALALLAALFMAGTAGGSLLFGTAARPRPVALGSQTLLLVVAGLVPLAPGATGPLALAAAAALSVLLGLLLGAHFAACAALWPGETAAAAGAGALYAADVLGAALAALAVPAVVIPVHGFAAAGGWAAAYAGVAMASVLAARVGRAAAHR